MGNPPGMANTALAADLYTTLRWQLVLLVVVTAACAGILLAARARALPALDAPGGTTAEPAGRRLLRVSLGALWIVDGLLQAQPAMPGSFVQQIITPGLDSTPGWLVSLVDPLGRVFLRHPVAADAMTVWIQVGLGVAVLAGGSRWLSRVVLIASAIWALFVWAFGEMLGGLMEPTASWLTGAPGAALLYFVASVLLLLPHRAWLSGRAARWSRASVGVTFLLGALLEALPRTGFWTPEGLASVLSDTASGGVPGPMASPVQWLADTTPAHPAVANALVVGVLTVLGFGLVLDLFRRTTTVAAAVVCFLGWWVGQGFGVFGGLGTDPNTGVVLIVLLAAGWPRAAVAGSADSAATVSDRPQTQVRRPRLLLGTTAAVCVVVLPLVAALGLLGPQTAQAAVGDSGGVVETAPTPAPDFTLTDQNGHQVAMRDLRGTLTVVVFLDPECFDSCPLLANQLATSVRSLGGDGQSVSVLAVDVNPVFNSVQDVRTFTEEHGLDAWPGWHFVTGPAAQVGEVLAAFGEGVSVPRVGMIGHPQNVYLFGRGGQELSVLNDTANDDLTDSYVQLITAELRRHL